MKKFVMGFLILFAAFSGFSQTKEDDIKRLLEITNVRQQAEQMFELIIPQMRALAPQVPQIFWDGFWENLDLDDFIKLYIPIYDRHFTREEIRQLIAFYESPAGKKVIQVTPQMAKESMIAGQLWGMELSKKILERMKKEGYLDT